MKAALLSRFDLVFIVLYRVDEERDRLLSEQVMNSHVRGKRRPMKSMRDNSASIPFQIPSRCADEPAVSDYVEAGTSGHQIRRACNVWSSNAAASSSSERIRAQHKRHFSLLRAEVHRLCSPYLKLRSAGEGQSPMDGIPITTRHLESLIYLSQARAQAELAETVSAEHAQDVVDIMQDCLLDMYVTEDDNLDFDRNGGMSLAKKVKIYYSFSFLSYINKSG
ncbi:hypothetical protein KXD40_004150 [Peronospora effusa]|uniref:MCM domain-containing protein n=1 Tax=Peronospora effusa TaxID=542832 RepID=A0A3R7XGG2_9STRA|nr:hypothetical protein DD237_006931 [Peronospora effusa]UIZ27881.1 hypothetical protein KXD40_004150 [Peronospora effusa]